MSIDQRHLALLDEDQGWRRQAILGWPCPECFVRAGKPCRKRNITTNGSTLGLSSRTRDRAREAQRETPRRGTELDAPHERRVALVRHIGPVLGRRWGCSVCEQGEHACARCGAPTAHLLAAACNTCRDAAWTP